MRFSKAVRSSKQCLPSPDGLHIATLFHSVVNIREVRSLKVIKVLSLPSDLSGPVYAFQWSPSSSLILVAVGDQVVVLSALEDTFKATIKNAVPAGAKPVAIGFGPSDTEIWVCSSFGLKLTLFDLRISKGVEITNPKFSTALSVRNGISYHPVSNHLAIMTRTAGRDIISIHDPVSKEVLRSWHPDTVDAQGLVWSPDGKWLVVRESDGQGHKVVFYTPDGNIFKTWTGPSNPPADFQHYHLGAGVKTVQFSADGRLLAIGDHSGGMCVLDMTSVNESLRLSHPQTIVPQETVQIWQEQVNAIQTGPAIHTFIKAEHAIMPPVRTSKDDADPKTGISTILFDPSSPLVVTKLDDAPSTLWVWDTGASELRAVLLFHSDVQSATWHPTCRETLMIRCSGDIYSNIVFVWDPLSEGPRTVDFSSHLPGQKASGKTQALWLRRGETEAPSLFFSDSQNYVLASVTESDGDYPLWEDDGNAESFQRDESPLELMPADTTDEPVLTEDEDGDASELEDTFVHKH